MAKAILNDIVLAESNDTVLIEGNVYFPPSSIKKEYFNESTTHTTCPWKGRANYYNIEVDGKKLNDVAWYYPEAKEAAKEIEGYVAFYKDQVKIEE